MSYDHHLAGSCDGISLRRDGDTTTIRFRSEDEARAFDHIFRDAVYAQIDGRPPAPAEQMEAPPGYALVPIVASKLMIDAGYRTYSQETLAPEWIARAVWTAMVSTAKLEDQP